AAIDLDYDLCGVEGVWQPRSGERLTVWLPHLDLAVARALTAGSTEHDRFWQAVRGAGQLTLQTRIRLAGLLRAAGPPGGVLDHPPTPEQPSLSFRSPDSFKVSRDGGPPTEGEHRTDHFSCGIEVRDPDGSLLPVAITLDKPEREAMFSVVY